MERQRSSSYSVATSYHLVSPKSLLLLSFASSSLLFSFLFSLFALRFGSPLHLPFAASVGANASAAIALAPGLGGGAPRSGAAPEVQGGGDMEGEPPADGARRAVAADSPVGSAMGVEEAVLGGGNRATPASGAVLGVPEFVVKEDAPGGGDGEKPTEDSVLEKPHSAEGKNLSKETLSSATESNASASARGGASSVKKLEGTESVDAADFAMEASGPALGTRGEILQGGREGGSGSSSVQGAYASQLGGQLESSDHSMVQNNSGVPLVLPKEDANLIQEATANKMDLTGNDAVQCDVYDGRWVFDESYPLYESISCPFIDEGFSCEANGRMDRSYTKWRWQPWHCNIPRFDATKMLDMLRGKRLVFAGDSINRNQWESMLCLLSKAVSDPSRIREARGRRITKERGDYKFKFLDYNCSAEYYVTHFLVHEGKARIGQKRKRTLRIDTIDRSSSRWGGANILVFNTAHWWSHHKTQAGVNYYQEGDTIHPHLDASIAFHRALTTWASWVDNNIDPRKTRVFFRSSSPAHFSGGEWNSGGHCRESTLPLNDTRARPAPERNLILEQVAKHMRTPVTVLNITNLSGLRIDGHPSVYGKKAGDAVTASSVQDCSHWCLPGVPDAWNELLFYHLLLPSQENEVAS